MKQVHGGNIEQAIKNYKLSKDEIVDFSANINFLGPPAGLMNHLQKSLKDIIHYPEPASNRFKKTLANHLKIDYENIIISNGAVELIYQITNYSEFEKALIPVPAFSEYEYATRSAGIQIKYIYNKREYDFNLDIKQIVKDFDSVDLVFICNPANPTGTLIKRKDIEYLLKYALSCGVFVVIDEAFIDFVSDKEEFTVLNMIGKYSNLFILRSMTKFYAIPGLRLGYGLGAPEIIEKLEKSRDPWSVNVVAQHAGMYIVEQKDYRQQSREKNIIEKNFFYNQLKQSKGLNPFFPAANYIFVDISDINYTATELTHKLAQKGLLIRNCKSYTGLDDNYIRVAIKSRKENQQLLETLNMIL